MDEDVIADAFEALVGAIYLDRGLQAASNFVITLAEVHNQSLHVYWLHANHHLQQLVSVLTTA